MTNETKQINLLIEVLQAIQENYGASDFLYPQAADEFNIDFAFASKPERFVEAAIAEDLNDLGLTIEYSDVYQDDTPIKGGYIIGIVLADGWVDALSIPAGSWAHMVLDKGN